MEMRKGSLPVAKRNNQLSNIMAAQCLSPTVTRPLPPDILQRSREIEYQQRRLIAGLGKRNDDFPSSTSVNVNGNTTPVVWRSGEVLSGQGSPSQQQPASGKSPASGRVFEDNNSQHKRCRSEPISTQQSLASGSQGGNGGNGAPTSATNNDTSKGSPSTNESEKRNKEGGVASGGIHKPASFRGRRAARPAQLDLDALRRERQFSGPYTANPLLQRKRARSLPRTSNTELEHEEKDEQRDDGTTPSTRQDQTRPMRLPNISQMTNGPFTPGINSPLQAFPQSAKTLPSVPLSAAPSLGSQFQSNSANTFFGTNPRMNSTGSSRGVPESVASLDQQEKKAKFLQLCSEAWDLLRS